MENKLVYFHEENLRRAKDINTSPDEIRRLFELNLSDINKAIVSNPNTPLDVLTELSFIYAPKILENPALFFFYVENPSFIKEFSRETLLRFASINTCPDWLLKEVFRLIPYDLLKSCCAYSDGINKWNNLREKFFDVRIDLSYKSFNRLSIMTSAPNKDNALNLSNADLTRTNLSHCNLSGFNFSNSDLTSVILQFSNCSDANFKNADLTSCFCMRTNLSNANFQNVTVNKASFVQVNFNKAKIKGTDFSKARIDQDYIVSKVKNEQKTRQNTSSRI